MYIRKQSVARTLKCGHEVITGLDSGVVAGSHKGDLSLSGVCDGRERLKIYTACPALGKE